MQQMVAGAGNNWLRPSWPWAWVWAGRRGFVQSGIIGFCRVLELRLPGYNAPCLSKAPSEVEQHMRRRYLQCARHAVPHTNTIQLGEVRRPETVSLRGDGLSMTRRLRIAGVRTGHPVKGGALVSNGGQWWAAAVWCLTCVTGLLLMLQHLICVWEGS